MNLLEFSRLALLPPFLSPVFPLVHSGTPSGFLLAFGWVI